MVEFSAAMSSSLMGDGSVDEGLMRARRYHKVQYGEGGLDVALGLNKAEHHMVDG